jgi:adenosylcobyric acid synthase
MLGERVVDEIESREGEVPGLGLLPVETVFEEEKLLGRPFGRASRFGDVGVSGYEIRHGRTSRHGGEPLFVGDGCDDGCREGAVVGTSWHGVMESDGFRRSFLRWVASVRGLDWRPGGFSFAAAREAQLERLGDLISENVDREALLRLIDDGPPHDLSVVRLQASGIRHQQRDSNADSAGGEVTTSASPALTMLGTDSDGPNLKAET